MKSEEYINNLQPLLPVTFDLQTNENYFIGWLITETEEEAQGQWRSFHLLPSGARVNFQRARASQEFPPHPHNAPWLGMFYIVDGYVFAGNDENCVEPMAKLPIIVFELLPLRQDLVKIKARCLNGLRDLAIVFYYYELLREIGTLWPEAQGAQRAVEEFWNDIEDGDEHIFPWSVEDGEIQSGKHNLLASRRSDIGTSRPGTLVACQKVLRELLDDPTIDLIVACHRNSEDVRTIRKAVVRTLPVFSESAQKIIIRRLIESGEDNKIKGLMQH